MTLVVERDINNNVQDNENIKIELINEIIDMNYKDCTKTNIEGLFNCT